MPSVPRPKFQVWPKIQQELSSIQIQTMYKRGFAGCEFRLNKIREAEDDFEEYIEAQGSWSNAYGEDAAYRWGIVGSGAGQLSLIFPAIMQLYPGALPGPAQQRGDCVSHSQKNANLGAMCAEVISGVPDPATGTIDAAPEVSPIGIQNGVLSTEAIYWYRRHGGDGWYCPAAAKVSTLEAGCVVRRKYGSIGIDLTTYSGRLAGKYGTRQPPPEIADALDEHLIKTATGLSGVEQLADFLHNGYAVSSCGGEGFSSSRDENGVSRRSGSWSHAMSYLAMDMRSWVQQVYNEPALVLVQNSWGRFNSGPRRIKDTNIDIPEGAFWAKWSDVSRRNMVAMSSVNGWPPKDLPNWGATGHV